MLQRHEEGSVLVWCWERWAGSCPHCSSWRLFCRFGLFLQVTRTRGGEERPQVSVTSSVPSAAVAELTLTCERVFSPCPDCTDLVFEF